MPHASDPAPGLCRIIHIGHEVSAGCGGDVEPRHDDDLTIALFTLYICFVGLTKTRTASSLRIPSVDTTKRRFCCTRSARLKLPVSIKPTFIRVAKGLG